MLTKLTAKNQITIPKKVLEKLPPTKYFRIEVRKGTILLRPLKFYEGDLETIREKMRKLGLSEDSVAEAVRWARSR